MNQELKVRGWPLKNLSLSPVKNAGGEFNIILTIYIYKRGYFKSSTPFLSYNSENISWVERRQQVMNFKKIKRNRL